MVKEPLRGFELVFGWNVAVAEPLPGPLEGDTLIHVGSLTDDDHDP
jgi:hypothetical protein